MSYCLMIMFSLPKSFETGDEVVRRLDKADGFNVLSEIPENISQAIEIGKIIYTSI